MAENEKQPDVDAKAKMLEALARKQGGKGHGVNPNSSGGSKIAGQSGANSPKMFRRKSGSA
jgi:hypothetical protein